MMQQTFYRTTIKYTTTIVIWKPIKSDNYAIYLIFKKSSIFFLTKGERKVEVSATSPDVVLYLRLGQYNQHDVQEEELWFVESRLGYLQLTKTHSDIFACIWLMMDCRL